MRHPPTATTIGCVRTFSFFHAWNRRDDESPRRRRRIRPDARQSRRRHGRIRAAVHNEDRRTRPMRRSQTRTLVGASSVREQLPVILIPATHAAPRSTGQLRTHTAKPRAVSHALPHPVVTRALGHRSRAPAARHTTTRVSHQFFSFFAGCAQLRVCLRFPLKTSHSLARIAALLWPQQRRAYRATFVRISPL